MFIGVPCFAVFYVAVKRICSLSLREKKGVDASESDVVSLKTTQINDLFLKVTFSYRDCIFLINKI